MILPSFQPAHPGISFFGTMESGFAATMVLALGPPSLPSPEKLAGVST